MKLRLEGQFKNYADLLLAYGIDDDTVIDERWKAWLEKIGSNYEEPTHPITLPATRFATGKLTMVTNYNAIDMTFDASIIMPQLSNVVYDPALGGSPSHTPPAVPAFPLVKGEVMVTSLSGEEIRYGRHIPIRVLETIDETNTAEHIYCTRCGYQVELESRYDNMPEFSWSELFPGHADFNGGEKKVAETGDPAAPVAIQPPMDGSDAATSPLGIPAITANFSPVKDDLIWCPEHRDYATFDTIENSIAAGMALLPPTPISDITEVYTKPTIDIVNDRSAPGQINDFSATTDLTGIISFRWTIALPGYPSPTFDLYDGTATLIQSRVNSMFTLDMGGATGPTDYYVQALNTEGTSDSNVASGESL